MNGRVCVIGAGISGLTTAFLLQRAGLEVTLFEKNDLVGGNIRTVRDGEYLLELGPNSLLLNRQAYDLLEMLHLEEEILRPNPNAKKRYILRNGSLTELPSKLISLPFTKAFSAAAKLRLMTEPLRRRGSENDTVRQFFDRRLGTEITDYAVDPFISGIYAGDPDRLSIRSAFPKLHAMEQEYRSLILGSIFSPKPRSERLPRNTPRSITFRNGMHTLPQRLSERLGNSLRLGTEVKAIRVDGKGFVVETQNGEAANFDSVVISTPARSAAKAIGTMDQATADALRKIYHPPLAVVFSAYPKDAVKIEPDGFGFLVPKKESRKLLGSLWTSSVFPGRAPNGTDLFTTFIGGSRNAELADRSDEELQRIAHAELSDIHGIDSNPIFSRVQKWPASIPQYTKEYEAIISTLDSFLAKHPRMHVCSNFYRGISVGDCIKNSFLTSEKIINELNGN